ncbi:MAG: hypothetical protein WAS73_04190 [Defluviicoccus sp.]
MDQPEAEVIYAAMRSAAEEEPRLKALLAAVIDGAVRYARLRTDWALVSATIADRDDAQKRADLDRRRTQAHDAFIDACNILSRQMQNLEMTTEWRGRLGDHRTTEGRKRIGDFACFVHCFVGLSAR